MNLYELSENYQYLSYLLEDDTENVGLIDTLESLNDVIEEKAENIAKWIKNLKSDIESLKQEEDRLKNKRQSLENRMQGLKEYLQQAMETTGKRSISAGVFTVRIQKNAPSLDIESEKAIPKKFYIEQEPKLDRKSLLAELKTGTIIDGVAIKQTESIRIS